ncbi:hypothetical protein LguiA_002032 [Lonicera macranthoides]
MEDNNEIKFGSDLYAKQTKDMVNENDQPVSHTKLKLIRMHLSLEWFSIPIKKFVSFIRNMLVLKGFDTMQRGSKSEEGMLRYFTLACAKAVESGMAWKLNIQDELRNVNTLRSRALSTGQKL